MIAIGFDFMPASQYSNKKISGWLAVNKPPGISSTSVVNLAKRVFKSKKAGHAGTLDKPASGLLAIAFGEATKTIPFITDSFKGYRFVVNLGASTDTDDATGTIIDQTGIIPSEQQILEGLEEFKGVILQTPPRYSSVKIDGQRAYQLAVKGKEVEIKPRPLTVRRLEFKGWVSENQIELEMDCSKGGYVRAIARDLGANLGCLAHVDNLTRLWSGPFDISDSLPFAKLTETTPDTQLLDWLLPLELGFHALPEITCSLSQANGIRNGMSASFPDSLIKDNSEVWVSWNNCAIAWGHIVDHVFHPKRIILQD